MPMRTRTGPRASPDRASRAAATAACDVGNATKNASVLGKLTGEPFRAELVQQPGRPLDVGEEERDGAGRELAHARPDDAPFSASQPMHATRWSGIGVAMRALSLS